jgi:hypothetical protein
METASIFELALCLIGCTFTIIGFGSYLRNQRLERYGHHADGTITQLVRSLTRSTDDSGPTVDYIPEFRFQDEAGLTHTVRSSCGSNPSPFKVGQQVKVVYEEANPSSAEIDSFGQMFLLPLIFMIAGPAMLIGAYAVWWTHRS